MPAVSFESCVSEMMSIGIESSSLTLSGAAENHTKVEPRIRTCATVDTVPPVPNRLRTLFQMVTTARIRLRTLLHFRHQCDPMKAGGLQPSHHPRHRAVGNLEVGAHEVRSSVTPRACVTACSLSTRPSTSISLFCR